jgi:hypothetical protein
MRIEELKKRLQNVGIDVSERTLRRWGEKGYITDHHKRAIERGRGHIEGWNEESFEEAAAFWAVRHSGVVQQKELLSAEKVTQIKKAAHRLFESINIFFESPSEFVIVTPPKFIFDVQALELTVKDNDLNNLAVTWIAARERARRYKTRARWYRTRRDKTRRHTSKTQLKRAFSKRVKIIIDWHYDPLYALSSYHSMLIPELDQIRRQISQPKEMARKIELFTDQFIGRLGDAERDRIQAERDATRFWRGTPRLKLLTSNKYELVVFLHSHQEFMEAQPARGS